MADNPFNPPAFPTTKPLDGWGDPNQGMSLLDWFAGMALSASYDFNYRHASATGKTDDFGENVAHDAYLIATAMLAERTRIEAQRRESGRG